MLMVVFHLGAERYAVQAGCVVEIIPMVALRAAPKTPPYVAGLFNYRMQVTPVIDFCQLVLNRPCTQMLSSRIILVDYDHVTGTVGTGPRRILGLLAECVTEVCARPEQTATPPVVSKSAPYLKEIFYRGAEMNQCVDVSTLLPSDVQEMLFAEYGK